jgi:putative ABC transport system substrate-binding protein
MRRREFVTLLGGATVAWPLLARAQQTALPVIGFLHSVSPEGYTARVAAYRQGLKDTGFVEGENIVIEFRWASGLLDRLPDMAAELIRRQVAVLVTAGSTPATIAAEKATSTIPIVFTTGADPVALGLVASLNRPGGNATGIVAMNADLAAKRLGLLRTLMPKADHFFTLVNPTDVLSGPFTKDLKDAAAALGIEVEVLLAGSEQEIAAAFASIPQRPGNVLVMGTDAFFFTHRSQVVALAAQYKLPTIYDNRQYAEAGGLIGYGTDFLDVMRQAGIYTGRVLKGEKPADLPVMQEAKFELVINLKAAKTLGLTVPPTLLALADEVIE